MSYLMSCFVEKEYVKEVHFTLSPIKGYLIPDKKKKADLVHKDD